MSDIIDTANKSFEYWLNGQIQQATKQAEPNDIDACEDCGKPIGTARKCAVPSATRCINCQTKYEIRNKR
ncbi:TraR/DksA family transcriptional regulator [Psychrobacter lutiphocae]|uniref:TraR/DksA family transcriptional regulator n=1 Tax=Psychrobacter lutiphocae TaxID=540500 RepID=UPI0003703D21|nr:TraR/DksA family transcriptional regulator [Psychrobacter lutiphocae]